MDFGGGNGNPLGNLSQEQQNAILQHISSLMSGGTPQAVVNPPSVSSAIPSHHATQVLFAPTTASAPSRPITEPYHGIGSQGFPPLSQSISSSVSPSISAPVTVSIPRTPALPGMHDLGVSLRTGHVNQARLLHAATSLPRAPALPRRRGRGPSAHAPALPRIQRPDIRLCYVDGAPIPTIRVTVQVYPLQTVSGRPSSQYFLYRFLKDSWTAQLEENHLLYHYELTLSSTVHALVQAVMTDMEHSPFLYQFPLQRRLSQLRARHEALPLQLLSLVAKGSARGTDNQVRLQPSPVRADYQLGQLAADKNKYAGSMCIDGDRLVIHLVSNYPLEATIDNRLHRCISTRVYSGFRYDTSGGPINDDSDGGDSDTSHGEDLTAGNNEMDVDFPAHHEAPAEVLASAGISQSQSHASGPLARTMSFLRMTAFLPAVIWDVAWVPPAVIPLISVSASSRAIANTIYRAATAGSDDPNMKLEIRGVDIDTLAEALDQKLAEAAAMDDFTSILVPANRRKFCIVTDTDDLRSLGAGIEREVVYAAFKKYTDNPGLWMNERLDKQFTLQTLHDLSSARWTPAVRLLSQKKLGALCSLLMILGQPPLPFDPSIFQFLIHDCNLQSLHMDFIAEWHPELRKTIQDWKEMGPNGDTAAFRGHFASFHDMDVASLESRDEPSHTAFAAEMLYKAVIGTDFRHPEWQSFIAGFNLPCRNGFRFSNIIKGFEGGSEAFLNILWSTRILDFTSLQPILRFHSPSATSANHLVAALASHNDTFTFEALVKGFLMGSGVPCPTLFNSIRDSVDRVVDLAHIDLPNFRAKIFAWAATGSPFLNSENLIHIHFIDNGDYMYASESHQNIMIAEGKICFRTCPREVRIPTSYIVTLATASYSSAAEPATFIQAFNHWLLSELLIAIGGHSIL